MSLLQEWHSLFVFVDEVSPIQSFSLTTTPHFGMQESPAKRAFLDQDMQKGAKNGSAATWTSEEKVHLRKEHYLLENSVLVKVRTEGMTEQSKRYVQERCIMSSPVKRLLSYPSIPHLGIQVPRHQDVFAGQQQCFDFISFL